MSKIGRPKIEIDWNEFDKLCQMQCTDQKIFSMDKRTAKIRNGAKIGLIPDELEFLCGVKLTKKENEQYFYLINRKNLKRRIKRMFPQRGKYPKTRLKSAFFSSLRHHIKQSGLDITVSQADFDSIFGYTLNDLVCHLEKFGVDINNYGKWEVDHIVPKSKLRFKEIGDSNFKKCWSLNNLQPLDKYENRAKRDK